MTVAYDTSSLARFTGAVRGRVPLLIGAVAIGAPAAFAFDAGLQLGEDVMHLGGPLSLRSVRNRLSRLLYDRRFGVSTADFADLSDFGLDHPERVYYSPAHWGTLRRALPRGHVGGGDVFVDLGAGKGRMALEAASRYPFRRVIGVELSAELTEVARANLAGTRLRLRAGGVEFVNSDVLDYVIPDDATVVFLNNPFRGEIFAATMDGLIASADRRPRPITVIYFNPVEEAYLLGTGRFRHVRTVTRRGGRPGDVYGTTRVYEVVPAVSDAGGRRPVEDGRPPASGDRDRP
ncbi:class I SAM-dependent methyltransferase [Nonomuraea sp. NPDC049725]|uniref:class I SAM-dependent methyltransferase n=1 Tax=Nonomuraea sp. NPDC049725 TaxID=3154508 RepID=UPI0034423F7C